MPSDPSGRHPAGVLTRHAADFFDDASAYGGFAGNLHLGGMDTYLQVSLYNDATIGYKLKVYGITVCNDGGGAMVAFTTSGVPTSTLVGRCNPIDASNPAPFGLIYQDTEHVAIGGPNPFTIPSVVAQLGSGGFDAGLSISPFPLFIVPAGYALNVVTFEPGALLGATFWYQEAIE